MASLSGALAPTDVGPFATIASLGAVSASVGATLPPFMCAALPMIGTALPPLLATTALPLEGAGIPAFLASFNHEPVVVPPKTPKDMETRELMIAQAAHQAEQAQYATQYQFWKQMKVQEAQEARAAARSASGGGKGPAPSRFRDDYRPMWLCKYMSARGACYKEERCTFAHSVDELHVMSPVLPRLGGTESTGLAEQGVQEPNEQPELQMKKKRDLCTQFDVGECLLGKLCPFAHGEKEIGSVGLAVSGNVKTQICQRWRDGKCLYGKLCNRAHGAHEIGLKRPPPELTKSNKRQKGESVFREESTAGVRGAAGSGSALQRRHPAAGVP